MFQTNQPASSALTTVCLRARLKLIGRKHHHWGIKGQVLPLAIGRQIWNAVF